MANDVTSEARSRTLFNYICSGQKNTLIISTATRKKIYDIGRPMKTRYIVMLLMATARNSFARNVKAELSESV